MIINVLKSRYFSNFIVIFFHASYMYIKYGPLDVKHDSIKSKQNKQVVTDSII